MMKSKRYLVVLVLLLPVLVACYPATPSVSPVTPTVDPDIYNQGAAHNGV